MIGAFTSVLHCVTLSVVLETSLPDTIMSRVHSNRLLQNSLTFPWHRPDSIHISLTKPKNKNCKWQLLKSISQNKRPMAKMMMSTKQSSVHNMTIWKRTYLRKLPCLDLANWSIYMETRESCCLKCSFSLTLCEIPWRSSSILPNAKISRTLCKVPWQFPDLEKFYFSLTFPWWLLTLMRNRLKLHRTTCIIFTTQYMNYSLRHCKSAT